ncbi:hypothetical protein T484DRAFT_1913304, partial [Baffinella frigidus]
MLEPGIGIICAVEDGAGGYDVTNAIVEDVPPSTSTSFQHGSRRKSEAPTYGPVSDSFGAPRIPREAGLDPPNRKDDAGPSGHEAQSSLMRRLSMIGQAESVMMIQSTLSGFSSFQGAGSAAEKKTQSSGGTFLGERKHSVVRAKEKPARPSAALALEKLARTSR